MSTATLARTLHSIADKEQFDRQNREVLAPGLVGDTPKKPQYW